MGDADAAITENIQAGQCNKVNSSLIMLGDEQFPCKVILYKECKTGKHGACKCTFMGRDIFTAQTHQASFTSTDTVKKPIVTRIEYTCTDIDAEGFLSLITPELDQKEDLKLPEESHLSDIAERIIEICEAG